MKNTGIIITIMFHLKKKNLPGFWTLCFGYKLWAGGQPSWKAEEKKKKVTQKLKFPKARDTFT